MTDPIVVRLNHTAYETLGSNSLGGFYAEKLYERHKNGSYKEGSDPLPGLILEVEQTDYSYREKNGPALVVIPEFVPYLMMENIMSFYRQGIKVTIKVIEVSEPQ